MSALYNCLKGKNDKNMAASTPEGTVSLEAEGTPEECSGKKKSKFQAFKKLFVKKKRKETPAPSIESNLKPSQSSSDVSISGANETVFHPGHEAVPKSNLGSKAVSHDSVFISEIENSTKEDISQENTPGKVKALQLQLQQNIRIGSPPQGIVNKKVEDTGTLSEDDGLPRSPPELTSLHEILAQSSSKNFSTSQRRNSLSLGGTDTEDELESCESSSRPISPRNSSVHLSPTSQVNGYILVDFATPPSSLACLDNSAAKHKIAVKPKKRKGLGMDMNHIKDGEGRHIKEKTNDETVVCEHEADIPQSGENTIEKEAPLMEDVVVQVDINPSAHEEDSEPEATMGRLVAHETSLADKQIVELHTEEDESDVDFYRSYLAVEDLVKNTEETNIGIETTLLAQISQPVLPNEQDDITAQFDPVEIHYAKTETIHLEVSEEQECDSSLEKQENISVFETNEPLDNEKKTQESNGEEISSNLPEQKFDLIDIYTKETKMVTTPKLLKGESAAALIIVGKDASNDASKSITINNCSNGENSLNSETLPESTPSSAVIDLPRIPDMSPSDENLGNLDLKTESSKDISVDSGVKSMTGAINLVNRIHNSVVNALSVNDTSSESSKTTSSLQENVDSKLTSTKPVRFTVAPAWQRSFSVGSSAKENNFSKDKETSTIRCESFNGSEKHGVEIHQENFKDNQMTNEMVDAREDDSCVAFGVRLRRTSSSRKYSEEYPEEKTKHRLLSDTMETISAQDVQKPPKTPQVCSDFTKLSKPLYHSEDKLWLKKKSEDLPPQETTEPAWITMAKLKQRGFQEHALARVHGAVTENQDEGGDECLQKKITDTSPQELEVRWIEPTSANLPVALDETRSEPGKNTRCAPPQNSEEPPWFSLAKKKAKAWSEMPPIVQ